MNMNSHPTLEEFKEFLAQGNSTAHHLLWLDASGEVHWTPVPDTLSPISWRLTGGNHVQLALGLLVRTVTPCTDEAAQTEACARQLFENLVCFWEIHQQAPVPVPVSESLANKANHSCRVPPTCR